MSDILLEALREINKLNESEDWAARLNVQDEKEKKLSRAEDKLIKKNLKANAKLSGEDAWLDRLNNFDARQSALSDIENESLNEDTAENELIRSHAHKEGGLTCPFCGSKDTKYVDTEQEANPEKDGVGGVGTQYVERHNYECNNCTCKFYTFTETIILRGTEIAKDGIDDNEEATIVLENNADIYADADDWDVSEGMPWDELKRHWLGDASDEEIKAECYEVDGLWYDGKMPRSLRNFFSDDPSLFIDLSNKMHELDISAVFENYGHNNMPSGYLSGIKKNLRAFVEWAAANAWQPFMDNPEDWYWENDNDEEEWEFTDVYR